MRSLCPSTRSRLHMCIQEQQPRRHLGQSRLSWVAARTMSLVQEAPAWCHLSLKMLFRKFNYTTNTSISAAWKRLKQYMNTSSKIWKVSFRPSLPVFLSRKLLQGPNSSFFRMNLQACHGSNLHHPQDPVLYIYRLYLIVSKVIFKHYF